MPCESLPTVITSGSSATCPSQPCVSLQALVPAVLQLAAMVFRMVSLSPLLTFSTLCVSMWPCLAAIALPLTFASLCF